MKVNIRGVWYDAELEPLIIELNNNDKKNISNMHREANRYLCYPDTLSLDEVREKLNLKLKVKCTKTDNDCEYDCSDICKESI